MQTLYNKVQQLIPIEEGLDLSERLRLDIMLSISIIGSILTFIHEVVTIFTTSFHLVIHLNNLLWFSLFSVPSYLLYKKKYQVTIYYFFFMALFTTASNHFCFGRGLELEVCYILNIFAAHYTMHKKHKIPLAILAILVHALITLKLHYSPAPYKHLCSSHFPVTYFLFNCFLLATLSYKVLLEYDTYTEISLEKQQILDSKNEQQKRFNYVIINDLKSPMRNIVSFSKLIERTESIEEKREYIDYIVSNGNQLDNIINNLRDFQEVTNQEEIQMEKVLIHKLINNARLASNNLLKQKHIQVSCDQFPYIYSYQYPLFIVFKNLINYISKSNIGKIEQIHFSNEGITPQGELKINIYLDDAINNTEQKIFDSQSEVRLSLESKIIIETLNKTVKGRLYINQLGNQTNSYTMILPLKVEEKSNQLLEKA